MKVSRIFKNRTALGVLSIALALVLSFVISPLIGKSRAGQTEVLRVSKNILAGERISSDKFTKVKVGSYNLPKDVLSAKEESYVVNKYAKTDMFTGDYFTEMKLTDIERIEDHYLSNDYNKNMAISISIKSGALGLSGKLKGGDIVTPLIRLDDEEPYIVQELMYLKVLATTTNEGLDREDAEKTDMPDTVTLSVNDVQASILSKFELDGEIHFALAYRGEKEKADAYLKLQQDYFMMMEELGLIEGLYDRSDLGSYNDYGDMFEGQGIENEVEDGGEND